MNPSIQPKKTTSLFVIIFVLGCLAALPGMQAVVPAPDGGYRGGNTAEGQTALLSLTTGGFNTADGFLSLRSNTTGSFNTAVGAGTLLANTADSNTATGAGALLSTSTGGQNTGNGAFALFSNTVGAGNTANGAYALQNNTTGPGNTANGFQALLSNTTGSYNTANGDQALSSNTTADNNTATGVDALFSNTVGSENTASGAYALQNNTNGSSNTASGHRALYSNTTGANNLATGAGALESNTQGIGNTAIGFLALFANTTGSGNIALGAGAGSGLSTGNSNIDIGNSGVPGESGTIRIGTDGTHTATHLAAVFGTFNVGNSEFVYVDPDGRLGTGPCARRFKTNIADMGAASDVLLSLRPVSFRYKPELDSKGYPQFGLIAEEVAEVNPDLVVRDAKGEIHSVRYEAVNAMLLNEFLKEHRKVEQMQKQIDALTAGLQKVSAQIEVSKPAPQTVLNNQ
jgi:hypothetical protein